MSKKKNRVFSIIGIIAAAVVAAGILLPFAVNEWLGIKAVIAPPEGKTYHRIEMDHDSAAAARKMVCTFSDHLMHIYTYEQNNDSDTAGARYDYEYSWNSYHHLAGDLYMTSAPSIMFWKNYEILDNETRDKAFVMIELTGINTFSCDDPDAIDEGSKKAVIITVKDHSIVLDGLEMPLITEDDATGFEIRSFDKNSQPYHKK